MFVALYLYFLPTVIASRNGHRHRGAIFLVNLFAGVTFVAWVVVLVWALYPPPDEKPSRS